MTSLLPLTIALLLPLAGCLADVGGMEDEDSTRQARAFYRGDLQPGDNAVQGGAEATVPGLGEGVFVEVTYDDGTSESLELTTDADGVVYQLADPQPQLDASGGDERIIAGGPAACSYRKYSLYGWRWNRPFDWKFRASSTPSYLNRDRVEQAVKRAAQNIKTSRNDCQMADKLDIVTRYGGRAHTGVQVLNNLKCGKRDGQSVVAFGYLPSGVHAVACVWTKNGGGRFAVESDIRLNKTYRRWYVDKPAKCSNRYDIEGVLTHEFGHTFGLGHAGGKQTMNPAIPACTNYARTLGRGDVLGLRRKY